MGEHEMLEGCQKMLDASELFDLRKLPEQPHLLSIGQKGYTPNDEDEEQVKNLLDDQETLLLHKRVARINDLIKADWDEKLQKSLTKKMKGKFTQHMGRTVDGQIALCPEETVFLLESGLLELFHCGVPLSIEEAYLLVLKGKLAIEKYQVYSYLSRLGYIVVLHQKKLYAALNNKGKTAKRKRKASKSCEPSKKVNFDTNPESNSKSDSQSNANFSASHSLNFSNVAEKLTSMESEECFEAVTVASESSCNIRCTEDAILAKAVMHEFQESVAVAVSQAPEPRGSTENVVTSETQDSAENVMITSDTQGNTENVMVTSETQDSTENVMVTSDTQGSTENVMATSDTQGSTENVMVTSESQDSTENVMVTSESQKAGENTNSDIISESAVLNDSLGNIADCTVAEKSIDIEVRAEVSNCYTGQDDNLLLGKLLASSSSDEELVTVTDSESMLEVDTDSLTCDVEIINDDEIVFLEVAKKEKEPLAVIELLSDDDGEDSGIKEGSNQSRGGESEEDDEVQIIAECSSSSSKIQHKEKSTKYFSRTSAKREFSDYPTANVDRKFNSSIQWQFPNLLRKTIVCLPCPPPHLLPMNVRLTKEAYTVDLRMITANNYSNNSTPRVWNSYRDLQERRRSNYHNGPNQSFSQFTNRDRSFSPNAPLPFNSYRQGMNANFNPRPFIGNLQPVKNNPFGTTSPFLGVKNEAWAHSSNSPLLNANFSGHEQFSDYVMYAQQAAMRVAENVFNQMTVPFGISVPHSLYSNAAEHPMVHSAQQNCNNSWNSVYSVNQQGLHHMVGDGRLPSNDVGNQSGFIGNRPILPEPNFGQSRLGRGTSWEHQTSDGQNSRNNIWPSFPFQSNPLLGNVNRDNFSQGGQWRHVAEVEQYPSNIPRLGIHVSSWHEFKSALGDASPENADDDIVEVPINVDEVLWSKTICPLVKLGTQNLDDVMKSLRITQSVNILTDKSWHLSNACRFEISFDVYLPGAVYKRSCPSVPNHRIVVVQASDPFPKMSDIVILQRKFMDSAILHFAVVSNGDVAFYSFNNVSIPAQL